MKDTYIRQIQRISSQSLKIILEDREKALEYAQKGIKKIEPRKLTKEYVEMVANGMQALAKLVLEERSK